MADTRTPLPVKLFVGMLSSIPSLFPEMEERLASHFGPVDTKSELFPFDQTRYYDEEMGSPLYRQFFSFAPLIDASGIAEVKLKTNAIETSTAERGWDIERPVNLDPGYVEQSKIVLASTKNFFHRILVAQGIYAEVTLHFQDKRWQDFPWTFPDYKSQRYQEYLSSLRNLYRTQLAAAGFRIHQKRAPKGGPPAR